MKLISTNMAITSSHPHRVSTHKTTTVGQTPKLPGENGNEKVELEDGFQPPPGTPRVVFFSITVFAMPMWCVCFCGVRGKIDCKTVVYFNTTW